MMNCNGQRLLVPDGPARYAFARRAGSVQPPSVAGFALRPLRWRKE